MEPHAVVQNVGMLHLTKQEQLVLLVVMSLLLLGWAVKSYRLAHPPSKPAVSARP